MEVKIVLKSVRDFFIRLRLGVEVYSMEQKGVYCVYNTNIVKENANISTDKRISGLNCCFFFMLNSN